MERSPCLSSFCFWRRGEDVAVSWLVLFISLVCLRGGYRLNPEDWTQSTLSAIGLCPEPAFFLIFILCIFNFCYGIFAFFYSILLNGISPPPQSFLSREGNLLYLLLLSTIDLKVFKWCFLANCMHFFSLEVFFECLRWSLNHMFKSKDYHTISAKEDKKALTVCCITQHNKNVLAPGI